MDKIRKGSDLRKEKWGSPSIQESKIAAKFSKPFTSLRNISEKTCGLFLKSPETLRAIFGCHNSLCISRTERISVIKLHSHFSFCHLENMLKDRLSKTSGWHFYKWLFGPEKFSGLSRNGSLSPQLSHDATRFHVPFLWKLFAPLASCLPSCLRCMTCA